MERAFRLDKSNAKLLGICAGLANATGWNVMLIRLGLVALTLFALGPVAVLAYLLIGWVAQG